MLENVPPGPLGSNGPGDPELFHLAAVGAIAWTAMFTLPKLLEAHSKSGDHDMDDELLIRSAAAIAESQRLVGEHRTLLRGQTAQTGRFVANACRELDFLAIAERRAIECAEGSIAASLDQRLVAPPADGRPVDA